MKKGFTLIELLAVIIILAVIALIATPIVLDVIEDAKASATDSKIKLYADSIKLKRIESLFKGLQVNDDDLSTLAAEVNDSNITCSNISYNEMTGVSLSNCQVNNEGNYCYVNGNVANGNEACGELLIGEINVVFANPSTGNWYTTDINVPVNIVNGDGYSWCKGSSECTPTSEKTNGTSFTTTIDTEGNNFICVMGYKGTNTSDIVCSNYKLDKTGPQFTFSFSGEMDTVSLSVSNYSDAASGLVDTPTFNFYYKDISSSEYILAYSGTTPSYQITGLDWSHANRYDLMATMTDNANNTTSKYHTAGTACFVSGTQVYTDSGYKNIEDITVGENVYTIDLETKDMVLSTVSSKYIGKSNQIYKIKIGDEIVEATPRHQFYIVDKGWVRAYDIAIGDMVTSPSGNLTIESIDLEEYETPVNVYNFSVNGNHNYMITKYSILVHNMGSGTWSE